MTNAHVIRGRGYQGLSAWAVENPDGQHYIPGRTVGIRPDAPESDGVPSWRAILAGFLPDGDAIVIPLSGHFGELRARRVLASGGRYGGGMWLPNDHPHAADECDWLEAKCLALSIAHAFDLVGRDS